MDTSTLPRVAFADAKVPSSDVTTIYSATIKLDGGRSVKAALIDTGGCVVEIEATLSDATVSVLRFALTDDAFLALLTVLTTITRHKMGRGDSPD